MKSLKPADSGLVRGIYRWDLVAVAINGIIGAGIFGLPAQVYRFTGRYSLLAFLVCALVVSCIVLCFAEVGGRFSDSGGPYLYARQAFGPIIGFEIGWLLWLARITAFASICNLLIQYLSYFWPKAGAGGWRVAIISAIVVTLTGLNLAGVRQAAVISDIFVIGKLIPLLLFVAAGIFFIKLANFSVVPGMNFKSFSHAVMISVFAFSGFEYTGIIAGETREPRRNLPFALMSAVGITAVLYLLIQFICIGTLPNLGNSERPLADAIQNFWGAAGGLLISIGVIISTFGTLSIILLAAPRILFALAEQGELPGFLKATHPRFHTPHWAILVSAAALLVVSVSGTFIYALTISTITRLLTYVATCAALVALRRNRTVPATIFKLPAGVPIAAIAIALCIWLIASITLREARDTAIAAATGLLLYAAYRLGQRPIVKQKAI
ncbi:MAG TPA: amino acid permease [Candidatus Angelobacter sp.]